MEQKRSYNHYPTSVYEPSKRSGGLWGRNAEKVSKMSPSGCHKKGVQSNWVFTNGSEREQTRSGSLKRDRKRRLTRANARKHRQTRTNAKLKNSPPFTHPLLRQPSSRGLRSWNPESFRRLSGDFPDSSRDFWVTFLGSRAGGPRKHFGAFSGFRGRRPRETFRDFFGISGPKWPRDLCKGRAGSQALLGFS